MKPGMLFKDGLHRLLRDGLATTALHESLEVLLGAPLQTYGWDLAEAKILALDLSTLDVHGCVAVSRLADYMKEHYTDDASER